MTVRTKSKARQWTVWLCAALALLAVYVVLSRGLFNSVTWDLFDPRLHRLAIPLVVFFFYVARNTRWDGIRREQGRGKREQGDEKDKVEGQGQERGGEGKAGGGGQRNCPDSEQARRNALPRSSVQPNGEAGRASPIAGAIAQPLNQDESGAERHVHCQPQPSASTSSLTGKDLFNQARALPHQPIPDFDNDAEYLDLLGKSAAAGYAPALVKLGEYAMRRAAWVEAYYWMKLAQRNGMHGLSPTLREIRKNWSLDGFPNQSSNVNMLFTVEAGSVGRALLHVDSGHEAAMAREFLKAIHPEFLT